MHLALWSALCFNLVDISTMYVRNRYQLLNNSGRNALRAFTKVSKTSPIDQLAKNVVCCGLSCCCFWDDWCEETVLPELGRSTSNEANDPWTVQMRVLKWFSKEWCSSYLRRKLARQCEKDRPSFSAIVQPWRSARTFWLTCLRKYGRGMYEYVYSIHLPGRI